MPDNIYCLLRNNCYRLEKVYNYFFLTIKLVQFSGQKAKSVMLDESSNHTELQKLNESNSSPA